MQMKHTVVVRVSLIAIMLALAAVQARAADL